MMNAFRLVAALVVIASPAGAREVAGVKVPDTVTVEGKPLKLNGAGIRKKFVIKVYVGALFVEAASTDPNAIIGSDQIKSVHLYFLRDVGREKILEAFREGFEKNSAPPKLAALNASLQQAASAIQDLKEGAEFVVTYLPGKGTTLGTKGGKEVTVAGKDFADALFRNWIGTYPADDDLKEQMLAGGK